MKNIMKTIGIAVAAAYLTLMPAKAEAAKAKVEVDAQHESTTLDVRVSGDLGAGFDFFARNRAAVDYDGNVNNFTVAHLNFELVDGLKLTSRNKLSGQGYVAQGGPSYFKKISDFILYTHLVGGVNAHTKQANLELSLLTEHEPKFNKIAGWYSRFEHETNVGKDGHNYSYQRFRTGPSFDKFWVGAAVDLWERGNEPESTYMLGGAVGAKF